MAQDGYECDPTQNHKLKHCEVFFVIMCHNLFNVWPMTTLLPVWPRDTKRLDTHELECSDYGSRVLELVLRHCWVSRNITK